MQASALYYSDLRVGLLAGELRGARLPEAFRLLKTSTDRVNFVRRFRGGNDASAVNFEKGSYIVVRGALRR
jgi:hypothetical protein